MSTAQPASQSPETAPNVAAKNSAPANFSRPNTSGGNPNPTPDATTNADVDRSAAVPASNPNTAPPASPTAPNQPFHATAAETEGPQTFNDKLNAADRYWKFKFGLAGVLIIVGLIGTGCFGWIMTSNPANSYSGYYYMDGYWMVWPCFITWSISIVFCTACIAKFLIHLRTVHPGIRVTMELLLWLGFIVTALLATSAYVELTYWGSEGELSGSSYYYGSHSTNGDYVLASNNTWVWEQDSSYVSMARDCNGTMLNIQAPDFFTSCEQQDAYVNKLWREKPHRLNVLITGAVCQWIGLVLHFALFVWACVDTHRRRRGRVSKDAEKLAANIVQNMIQNGAVVPPPRRSMGQSVYYMLPNQGSQGQFGQQGPQGGMMHQQQQQQQQQQFYQPMANTHPAYRMPPQQQNMQMQQGRYHQPGPQGQMGQPAGPGGEKGQPRYA